MPWLSKWISRHSTERASFQFVYKILARDRKIKLKVYPTFGYIVILAFIFSIGIERDYANALHNLPNTQHYLILLYLVFMVLQMALYELPYSDDFKASWIYYSAPLERPGLILTGMLKAVFVRLFMPAYLLVSAAVFAVWGAEVIDDIIFAFVNNFLMLVLIAIINEKALPLSLQPSVRNQTGSFIRSIIIFIAIGILGLGHFFLTNYPWILLAMIPVQCIVAALLFRYYQRTRWDRITL
jgi:ABC-2 type transport system permease protein